MQFYWQSQVGSIHHLWDFNWRWEFVTDHLLNVLLFITLDFFWLANIEFASQCQESIRHFSIKYSHGKEHPLYTPLPNQKKKIPLQNQSCL